MTKAIIGLLAAGFLSVAPVSGESAGKIEICFDSANYRSLQVLVRSKIITTQMFAGAGVTVYWLSPGAAACRNALQTQAIVVEFVADAPPNQHPGALAYARPYDGAHIVVFIDRIERTVHTPEVHSLLAYVMAHEIAHLIEGIARHSQTGVMKARWNVQDYARMAEATLPFAAEDIDLIHLGLARRAARAEAAAPLATVATPGGAGIRPHD